MQIADLITITKLKDVKDDKSKEAAFRRGDIFKYKKEGNMNYVFHNGTNMRYLTYLEFAPNKARGNHYHKKKEENIIVIKGKIKAKYYLLDEHSETLELELEAGDIVNIKPGVVHVYFSENGASAIEFSPQILDYDDQIKVL